MKTAAFLPARERGTVDDMSTETRERTAGEDDSRSRDGFGPRFVAATSFGCVLNPVNSSIIAVALVSIGRAFGVTSASTTWLISALYLATAIGQPTMGRLADLVGPRRVYLAGTAAVAVGGLIGWAGWSLGSLVAARVVIGLGTSAAYPAAMAMVRRQSRRLRREPPPSVLGTLAIAGQVSMAAGPPLGGLLLAAGGWRATFAINVPLAAVGALTVLAWLPPDGQPLRLGRVWHQVDPPGLALLTCALTALLVFLMDLTAPHWWLLAVTVALLLALTARELRASEPFIDVRMLAHNRALTTTYLRYGVTMAVTYGFIYGWTPWLEQSASMSATEAGLLMMPAFAIAAVVSSLLAVSLVFGVQNGLNIVTNQAAMYEQAPPDAVGVAAGMLRTFMYLGAIASASLISLSYGRAATDAGLHRLGLILTVAAIAVVVVTVSDRSRVGAGEAA